MWGHTFAKGEKHAEFRIWAATCKDHREGKPKTAFMFLFFNRQKVTASSSH